MVSDSNRTPQWKSHFLRAHSEQAGLARPSGRRSGALGLLDIGMESDINLLNPDTIAECMSAVSCDRLPEDRAAA